MRDRRFRLSRPSLFELVLPFWVSKGRWVALLMLTAVIGIGFGQTYLMVLDNKLDGKVMDAMVGRDWPALWPVLLMSMGVGLSTVVVTASKVVVSDRLKLRWRTWMTRRLLRAWTNSNVYYAVEREGRVDNPDQRIAQDVATFVQMTQDYFTGAIYVVVNTVTFTILLWQLSGTLSFTALGQPITIPGYQVWLVYLYGISVVLVAHYFGRQLVRLFNRRQTVEADFRFLGMQLRENAEQIAFYNGGRRERERMVQSFEQVRRNTIDIIWRTCKMTVCRDVYVQACSILPTLASLPRYLSGAISLGDLTRTVGAFNTLKSALSWWYQAYVGFAEWVAISRRLRELSAALNLHAVGGERVLVSHASDSDIRTTGLQLRDPQGNVLTDIGPWRIAPGERWLVHGRSGSGKSTLLRALAGIWPHGSGEVMLPVDALVMFLPQRSYIPAGTLRSGLCYPAEPDRFSEAQCREVLRACRLEHYVDQLDVSDRWQKRLSGGEQQRLAIARALLHAPEFLFLDEATSALDPETEQVLYTALRERLPHAALVSVAHRAELAAFHDRVFEVTHQPKSKLD